MVDTISARYNASEHQHRTLTLIETAEMNNVDPEAWLTWVLERIADHRLTPSTNLCRGTGSPKTSKTRPDRTDTHEGLRDIFEPALSKARHIRS